MSADPSRSYRRVGPNDSGRAVTAVRMLQVSRVEEGEPVVMDDFPMRRGFGQGWGDGYGPMHDGVGWVGWVFMVLMMLLFVAVIVGVVVLLVRSTSGGSAAPRSTAGSGSGQGSEASGAQQMLDERFARGEIEEEEYLRRRSVLRGG